MQIRPYRLEDYQAVRNNLDRNRLTDTDVDTENLLAAKVRRDPESILVAELDGQVVGNVFSLDDGWNSFIFRLAVVPEQHGKGIGTKLLEAAEERLRGRGNKQVMLFVDEADTDLKEYYQRRGYKLGTKPLRTMYKLFE